MKAIGIVGYHHTGKTTLAVHLIKALSSLGHEVASIKDIHAESYRADKEGSNSWKHAQAGASQVFARGLQDAALVFTPAPDLPQMLSLLRADFLVIEGMKSAAVPKIVCAETTAQIDELLDDTVFAISGKISDELESYKGLPVFCLQKHSQELLDTVMRNAFPILPQSEVECCGECDKSCYILAGDIVQGRAQRTACVQDNQNKLILEVGGKPIALVPFVQKLLHDSIVAFTNNLKGIDSDSEIKITIRR